VGDGITSLATFPCSMVVLPTAGGARFNVHLLLLSRFSHRALLNSLCAERDAGLPANAGHDRSIAAAADADSARGLQVWNGHVRETELVVLDAAVAVESFWAPKDGQARLAVAAGPHVYIYIGTTIHYKVALPKEHVQSEDETVWCATSLCCATL
jgi:hypothetical protein